MRDQHEQSGGATSKPEAAGPESATGRDAEINFLPPLKPRPRLMILMSALLGFWVAMLLAIFFTVIYPAHHRGSRTVVPYE
jgi:hypothetical protein